jgi:hypothetical protein
MRARVASATSLAVLACLIVIASPVQALGYTWAREGSCGGRAPLTLSCSAQPVVLNGLHDPVNDRWTVEGDSYCPSSTDCIPFEGTIVGSMLGPNGGVGTSCTVNVGGTFCVETFRYGQVLPGDEVSVSAWVSGAAGPAIGDWRVLATVEEYR